MDELTALMKTLGVEPYVGDVLVRQQALGDFLNDAGEARDGFRWDIDAPHGLLVFRDGTGELIAHFEVQFIGSFAQAQEAWLWGWANSSIPEALLKDVIGLRDRVELRDHPLIKNASLPVTGDMPHILAILATGVLGFEGYFSAMVNDGLDVFFGLKNVPLAFETFLAEKGLLAMTRKARLQNFTGLVVPITNLPVQPQLVIDGYLGPADNTDEAGVNIWRAEGMELRVRLDELGRIADANLKVEPSY